MKSCWRRNYDLRLIPFLNFFRHLRFLLRKADEAIQKVATLTEIQNQATATTTVVQALRTELASTTQKQSLDRANSAEEKDGRLNEK
jgi:hypothetical protein